MPEIIEIIIVGLIITVFLMIMAALALGSRCDRERRATHDEDHD